MYERTRNHLRGTPALSGSRKRNQQTRLSTRLSIAGRNRANSDRRLTIGRSNFLNNKRRRAANSIRTDVQRPSARVGDDAGPSKSNSRGVENANVQADIQAQGRHEVEGAIGTASRKVGGGFLEPEIEKRRGLCRTTQGGWYTVLFEVNR